MSFWVAGAIVVSSVATGVQQHKAQRAQKKAQKKAKEDALESEKQARRAEVFAETEGLGQGNLGKVSLEVDDELDEDAEVSTGNIRI